MSLLWSCGQNAHLTAPTPAPTLKNSYSGNDLSNGDYSIAIGANNDTGTPFTGHEHVTITLDSPDGQTIYFAGGFQMGMDLAKAAPLSVDPRSIQSWASVQSAISSGLIAPKSQIVFDKRKWALAGGQETYYFRLFDINQTLVPELRRRTAQPLRLTLAIENQYGLGSSAQVIMPVRFRYAFDDEAFGPAQVAANGVVAYSPDPTVTTRVIAGLESVSNPALTTPDLACEAAFGLSYPFDFIDMTGVYHKYSAQATALRGPDQTWSEISVVRPSILEAIGSSLGGSVATFTSPPDYEGLCNRKVYGFVLTDRFINMDLTGIRLSIQDGALQGDVVYGLTKMEAF